MFCDLAIRRKQFNLVLPSVLSNDKTLRDKRFKVALYYRWMFCDLATRRNIALNAVKNDILSVNIPCFTGVSYYLLPLCHCELALS